jgi:hypothetical protein
MIFLRFSFLLGINCELKYIKSDGSFTCGFFISGRLDWHQAVKECQEYDAKLPSINSESDNKNILSVKVTFSV